MKISVIIPALNEAKSIEKTLRKVSNEKPFEIIVVDGNSSDKTRQIAKKYATVIKHTGNKWRSTLMNIGANAAKGDWLFFLHAKVLIPKGAFKLIDTKYNAATYFLTWKNKHWLMRLNEFFTNYNQVLLKKVIFGDHCLAINKEVFRNLKGFRSMPLMEDHEFSSRLKKVTKIQVIRKKVVANPRRWMKNGIYLQTFTNNIIKLLYSFGVSPKTLRKIYLRAIQ